MRIFSRRLRFALLFVALAALLSAALASGQENPGTPPPGGALPGVTLASGYAGGNGLNRAIAAAGTGGMVWVDPAYKGKEFPYTFSEEGETIWISTFLAPDRFQLTDSRMGRQYHFAHNPGNFLEGLASSYRYDGGDPALGNFNHVNLGAYMIDAGPSTYSADGHETTAHNLRLNSIFATKGLHQGTSSTVYCYGIGDCGNYWYNWYFGGSINGDDEASKAYEFDMVAGNNNGFIPLKSIDGVGQEGAYLTLQDAGALVNPSAVNMHDLGSGRYAVLVRQGAPSGNAGTDAPNFRLAIDGMYKPDVFRSPMQLGFLTVAESSGEIPLSATWGLSDAFKVPTNNDAAQRVETTIAVNPLSPSWTAGRMGFHSGAACLWGRNRTEIVRLEAGALDAATGRQKVTVYVRQDPAGAGGGQAYFFQDTAGAGVHGTGLTGFCQTVGRTAEWDNGLGRNNQSVRLVGSILQNVNGRNRRVIVYSFNGTFGQQEYPMQLPFVIHARLTRKTLGGKSVVSVETMDQAHPGDTPLNHNPTATVASTQDPSFNTGTPVTFSNDATGTYSYTAAAAQPPVTRAVEATITLGSGLSAMKVYPAAEVIGFACGGGRPHTLGSCVDLEYNSIRWPAAAAGGHGGLVDFPAHYATNAHEGGRILTSTQPMVQMDGDTFVYGGPGVTSRFVAQTYINETARSFYAGEGGYVPGPTMARIAGPHRVIFSFGKNVFNQDDNQLPGLMSGTILHNLPCATTEECTSANDFVFFNTSDVSDGHGHRAQGGYFELLNQHSGTYTVGFGGDSTLTVQRGGGTSVNAAFSAPSLAATGLTPGAGVAVGPGGTLVSAAAVTLDVGFGGTQATVADGFRRVTFNRVVTDSARGWNGETNVYTIPVSGTYEIVTRMRGADGTGAGISYGQGANPTMEDTGDFAWATTAAAPASRTARQELANTRIVHLKEGEKVQMYYFMDGKAFPIVGAKMEIVLLGRP